MCVARPGTRRPPAWLSVWWAWSARTMVCCSTLPQGRRDHSASGTEDPLGGRPLAPAIRRSDRRHASVDGRWRGTTEAAAPFDRPVCRSDSGCVHKCGYSLHHAAGHLVCPRHGVARRRAALHSLPGPLPPEFCRRPRDGRTGKPMARWQPPRVATRCSQPGRRPTASTAVVLRITTPPTSRHRDGAQLTGPKTRCVPSPRPMAAPKGQMCSRTGAEGQHRRGRFRGTSAWRNPFHGRFIDHTPSTTRASPACRCTAVANLKTPPRKANSGTTDGAPIRTATEPAWSKPAALNDWRDKWPAKTSRLTRCPSHRNTPQAVFSDQNARKAAGWIRG